MEVEGSQKKEAKAPARPPIKSTWSFENSFALRGAVSGDQAGLADLGVGADGAQAGSLEIRPGALRAVAADCVHVEPVALGERWGGRGFDLGGEAGKNGEGCCDKRGNGDSRKSFDHDGPLSVAFWPVVWLMP